MVERGNFLQRLRRDQRGNVMYLTAGLIMPIFATIGAGVDLGQAYMAKSRLQQACDAGVLAGRKIMAEGTYSTAARGAATNMFNFNYPTGIYDSTNITFNSQQRGSSEVTGTATARVSTILMHMFGKPHFDLTVNCAAKLEIANTDIMFVLDTTGSMANVNSGDSVNRLAALKTEVMAFFDTVSSAQQGDAVIRYGVMPYSSNVNVGNILRASNTGWVSTSANIPSRIANFDTIDLPETTTGPTATYSNVSGSFSYTTNSNFTGATLSGRTSSNCGSAVPDPRYQDVTRTAGPNTTTNTVPGANGSSTTTTTTTETWTVYQLRYLWYNSACRLQRSSNTRSATKTTVSTATNNPPYQQFRDYTYRMINYNVAGIFNGTGLTVPTGTQGANVTANWNGCIMERDTVAFDDAAALPAGTFDLDVDLVPNSEATRWHIALPNIAHPRSSSPGNSQSQTPADLTTTNDYAAYTAHASGGWEACPTQAMKLTALTSANRTTFQTYINSLIAIGGTYHDVGMVWGTRFISPTGLFASENTTAANGMPISRHIIFMTDGEMAPNPGIYGFQGQEYLHRRVGSTDTTELTARHNRRFQEACNAAKGRNITVWVVSFGTSLNDSLRACASGDKAYQASNNAQLRTQFQAIAQQITRLRLSE